MKWSLSVVMSCLLVTGLAWPTTATPPYTLIMMEGLGLCTNDQSEVLKIIQKNGLKVKSMTVELLNAVMLDSGQIELKLQPVDLVDLVMEVASETEEKIQSKKQVLDLEFSPGLPPAQCDEDWTRQIVIILLVNACKYSPESGHIAIRVRQTEKPGFLQLSVADSGGGLSVQEQAKIFSGDSGGQSAPADLSQSPSTGLFLPRSLVELTGGSIWVEPQPILGSVFHVTLPIAAQSGLWFNDLILTT